MVELVLKYDDNDDIKITWMRDVWKDMQKPDSLEVSIPNQLLNTEKIWLERLVNWTYSNNDNRDMKINDKFVNVDDYLDE